MDDQFSEESSHYFPAKYEENEVSPKRQRFTRPKVYDSSFWSDENILKLITAIKNFPAIWQTDSEGFKSRARRETAWQKVSEAFDDEIIDPNQLVAKWQNLRTQYRSVRTAAKKYARSKIGKKPTWRFFNQMTFIDNEMLNESDVSRTAINPEQIESSSEDIADVNTKRGGNRRVVNSAFWNNDETVLKLINAVRKRKSIWDFNDENYKDHYKRESDWRSIGDEFKNRISINQLAAKWQNLRTTYRSNKNPTKKMKGKYGNLQTPKWRLYRFLTFLDAGEEPVKGQVEEMEDIEELEEVESVVASEEFILNETNDNVFIQNDLEDNAVKKEYNEESTSDPLQKNESDNIEIFGSFFISELRKIKNQAYLESTQRRILQFLWQCIDDEPAQASN